MRPTARSLHEALPTPSVHALKWALIISLVPNLYLGQYSGIRTPIIVREHAKYLFLAFHPNGDLELSKQAYSELVLYYFQSGPGRLNQCHLDHGSVLDSRHKAGQIVRPRGPHESWTILADL